MIKALQNCARDAIVIPGLNMLDDLITVKEAIAEYGLSGAYLRRLLAQGVIRGRKLGASWVIVPASLERFLKTERKRGRPPIDK